MKNTAISEKDMREVTAPSPDTMQELAEYITSLVGMEHDYGTCVYAMSLAATAAFNHVAHKLGVTGFQASCANLDIVRRTRSIKGPFILLKGEDMLYPQYNLPGRLTKAMEGWQEWVAKEAVKLLDSDQGHACDSVREHWKKLASYTKPEVVDKINVASNDATEV